MARPKLHKTPKKLNISIDNDTKRKAFTLATRDGVSISAMIAKLIEEAHGKVATVAVIILLGLCVIRSESRTHNTPPSFAPASFASEQTN